MEHSDAESKVEEAVLATWLETILVIFWQMWVLYALVLKICLRLHSRILG